MSPQCDVASIPTYKHYSLRDKMEDDDMLISTEGRVVEVRPGRHLFCRHRVVSGRGGDSDSGGGGTSKNGDDVDKGDNVSSDDVIHLICIHGTAASHDQFLPLLDQIEDHCQLLSTTTVHAWMYDAAGCGRSPNPPSYSASASSSSPYSDEEQVLDLEAFLHKFVRKKIEKDQPHQRHHQQQDRQKTQCRIFFIGHSYGPNWIYKFMIYEQKKESEQRRNYHLRKQTEASPSLSLLFQIEGLVLISTGVGDSTLLVKGGPPIFRYCPVFVLRCVQPILTELFLRMGFAKNTHATKPLLVQVARRSNNQNDMSTICHYYRSHDWISQDDLRDFYEQLVAPARQTSDDITPQGDDDDSIIRSKRRVRVLVLHGDEDQIIPIEKGQIVANILMTKDIYKAQKNSCNIGENIIDSTENDSDNDALLVISDASHSIMQEQPDMLSKHILQFIGIRDIQI